jgi:hypothetical protein
MMPIGAKGSPNGPNGTEAGFNNTDANGNPIDPIANQVVDFGWEYVFHCHILSHEEMDMMRPFTVHVARALPDAPVLSFTRGSVILNWTDGTPVSYTNLATWGTSKAEVGYRIERAEDTNGVAGPYTEIANAPANTITYTDHPPDPTLTYDYRVTASNAAGNSPSNVITVEGLPKAPTALTAEVQPVATLPAGAQVALNWIDNAGNATSVVVERATGAGAFSLLATLAPVDASYTDPTVMPGAYSYRVRALNGAGPSAYAGPVSVNVPQPASTTAVLSNANPSSVGDTVTFTATVSSGQAAGIPSGTVAFTANGATTSVALDAAGVATLTTSGLPAGASTITADYSGDAVFKPSTGTLIQTVNKAATTIVVVSNLNPSTLGAAVTFTATVSPLTATGTVDFTIDGALRANATLVAGQATYTTSALTVRAHAVVATYGGAAAYLGSNAPTLTQTVGPVLRATATVVASNRNPSASLGQNITFTATVRPLTGTGTPTGTVRFNIDGANVGGTLTLNAQGRATYSTATLQAGSHSVIATYGGSATFAGGGSAALTQVVNQAASAIVVATNHNPALFGQTVTFTARVTPAAAIGTVQFTLDGADIGGPVALDATGRARLVMTSLSVGAHTVSAAYAGSINYRASTSASLTQTVNKAATRTIVTTSGSPAARGATVVLTATLAAVLPGAGVPSGTVQFRLDGVAVGAPAALNSSGQAAFATSSLTVGRHTVAAAYSGDGNFNASTSGNITQRIR